MTAGGGILSETSRLEFLESKTRSWNGLMKAENLCLMKKFFSQMLAVSMVLLLFQCDRKEDISPSSDVNFADYLSTPEFVPLPELDSYRVPKEEVRAKIRSYLSQRNSRTNAEFPASEAIWYIETLPNYFQGKANVSYKELILTEHLYYLGSDANAMVSSAQIDELAATIEMQAVSDKNAAPCASTEKNTIFVSVTPVTNASGSIYLQAKVGTGVQCTDPPPGEDPPYDTNEDFCDLSTSPHSWVAIGEGTCGAGPQINTTMGSAEKIASVINSFDEVGGCPIRLSYSPTENGFFTNIWESTDIYAEFPYGYQTFLNPNDNQPEDGYRDSWLFSSWDTDTVGRISCLNPDEMSFYYGGAIRVINWYRTNQAVGRDFISCEMWADVLLAPSGTGNTQHGIQIKVGDYVP